MTTTAEPLVDLGPCDWCGHPQWSHKRGKGGCKDVECGGVCDRYAPPKDRPMPAADPQPAGHPTLAEVEAEPEPADEPDPEPEPEPVVDPAAQAEHADQVAAVDEQLAQPEPADDETDPARLAGQLGARLRDLDQAQERVAQLQRGARVLSAERNEARAELANLRREVVEREEQVARERGARLAEIAQLREELDRATAARQRLQEQVDTAVHTGLNAATQVIGRYPAHACLTCGARYGLPFTDHGCGPLVPVVVTIARADRPGPNTKEQ
ncbi:hypothetical protein [Micromonospora robiginosa]|uniref:Uncharacterized protein n=1 Tax=Micromonospora robiginosa TaxID=2749844 RepID=A0A7L6B7T5_9ACTN|nr:hypothetical protein [Micromonospora ferruginea]QLQ37964.1 hypothetical protein H1D33_03460 [Micromonospora ferruginea]